jgi:hypothetical protein
MFDEYLQLATLDLRDLRNGRCYLPSDEMKSPAYCRQCDFMLKKLHRSKIVDSLIILMMTGHVPRDRRGEGQKTLDKALKIVPDSVSKYFI